MPDPPDLSQASLTVSLEEYDALSSAIASAIKRIETVRGLYVTGVLAIVAVLFKVRPEEVTSGLSRIESSPYLLAPSANTLAEFAAAYLRRLINAFYFGCYKIQHICTWAASPGPNARKSSTV
jgi:hypothetical protein